MRFGAKSKKPIALILCAALLAAALTVAAVAFFTSSFFKTLTGQVEGSGDTVTVVEITTFDELFAYSVGADGTGIFNDSAAVSPLSGRYILTLTADLTLAADLTLTADCHLDLGGNTLYLNGHSLAFSHTYHGTVILKNGTVVVDNDPEEGESATDGKIYFDTPYAVASAETVTFARRDGTALDFAGVSADVSGIAAVVAYHALRIATAKLCNLTDLALAAPAFAELAAKSDTVFDPALFLTSKTCTAAGATEACAFVFRDLDLPGNVLALKDVTLEYASSDEAVISPAGKVTPNTGTASVTLTITVRRGETVIGTCALPLHVLNTENNAVLAAAGETMIHSFLSRYYSEEGDTAGTLVFKRSLYLPARVPVGGGKYITFAFGAYSDAALTNEVADVITVPKKTENGATVSNDEVYYLEPTSAVQYLTVTVTCGESSLSSSFKVTASDAGLVRTQVSLAQDFILANYGGQITLARVSGSPDSAPEFFGRELLSPAKGDAHSSIQSIKYSLINDTNALYELTGCDAALDGETNGYLSVRAGKNPLDYIQTVQLDCLVTFTDGTTAQLQIPVRCSNDVSTNVGRFVSWYNYYDQMFFSTTACYTAKTFTMPFATGNSAADFTVCYDMRVTGADGTVNWNTLSGISVGLYYNGKVQVTLTPTAGAAPFTYSSYVNALNTYLSGLADAEGTTVLKILQKIIAYGDAKWQFTITADELLTSNQDFEFVYNYRQLSTGSSGFSRHEDSSFVPIVTGFTLPGVLTFGGAGSVLRDANLYAWMGAVFGGGSFRNGDPILTDWLKQNLPVDVTDAVNGATLAAVRDFCGIQYISGATLVNLTGVDLSGKLADNLNYLGEMNAIETLNLTNCGIVSVFSATAPNDENLTRLTGLKNLKILYLGNAYGTTTNLNRIESFEFLLQIPSLTVVYVYGNTPTDTSSTTAAVKQIFYGSTGLVNMEYFGELTSAGVAVYNTVSETTPLLFENASGVNAYKILLGIEYQKKLREGESISAVYADFAGATAADLGLDTLSYTIGTTTYTVTASELRWGVDGDDPTTATQFYVIYHITTMTASSGATISPDVDIRVNFEIVRVANETV